ncbi:ABC transporter substrate-binding protein [Candidatus Methylospira mobilis]|nr:ABC transporter substrate-binding protein [Candidatus Methylospira mobilis]
MISNPLVMRGFSAANGVFTGCPWDLLANVPVPLRHQVCDGIAGVVAQTESANGKAFKWHIPLGQGGVSPFDKLRFIHSLADYPNMLVSADHGSAFNRRFQERYLMKGAFSGAQPEGAATVFSDSGLIDPAGWIGVFAVAPFVMLIDHRRLGGLPTPCRWADLMEPVYRNQVVFSGWKREGDSRYSQFNKFFLLAMSKEFGLNGMSRIVANVPSLLHSAQMPRLAGTASSPGGIYVLPWAQADMCPRRGQTEVVWPEEGALAYPLWLTVKSSHRLSLDVLVRHFYGAELGGILNQNRYPSLCTGLPPSVPAGSKLNWLGWDFVRHPATAKLIQAVSRTFLDAMDKRQTKGMRLCA